MSTAIEERLTPRDFSESVEVVSRHMTRYLDAVQMFSSTSDAVDYSRLCAIDWGCGSGYGTEILRQFFGSVRGYDPYMPFPVNTMIAGDADAVFLVEVVEHVPQNAAAEMLESMGVFVANGGRLMVSTPIARVDNPSPVNPHHVHEYGLAELMQLFTATGYRVIGSQIAQTKFTDGETKGQGLFALEVK